MTTLVCFFAEDKENFEHMWKQKSLPAWRGGEQSGAMVPGSESALDTKRDSIFYNLFGGSFKGFPSASDK